MLGGRFDYNFQRDRRNSNELPETTTLVEHHPDNINPIKLRLTCVKNNIKLFLQNYYSIFKVEGGEGVFPLIVDPVPGSVLPI